MALPASFLKDGFQTIDNSRKRRFLPGLKRPGIMITTEGPTNTGKTEFMMSCPDPGIIIAVDKGHDAMLDNPNPPPTRRKDFAFDEVEVSQAAQKEDHVKSWNNFRERLMVAIKNPDAITVGIDGDSDTWETQRLAEFGKLTQVPSIMYVNANASRRALISRLFFSGKIIVATNKVKAEYVAKRDEEGNVVLKDGKEIREKSGRMAKQGFEDDDYLWHIALEHFVNPARFNAITKKAVPMEWGIRILKCKANPQLKGMELTGADCSFAGLVSLAYPNVALSEWGLK